MSRTFPSRWKAHKLDRLGSVNRGRSRHRPRNDPSLYGGEYPFFQTGDIKTANLYLSHYSQTYNEKGLSQSKQWEPGTLCITIAANIADTAILGIRGCFPDSVIGFISDPMKADVRFIKYYIDFIKLDMQQVSHGTTQDNLSLEKLLSFDFVVPDIEETTQDRRCPLGLRRSNRETICVASRFSRKWRRIFTENGLSNFASPGMRRSGLWIRRLGGCRRDGRWIPSKILLPFSVVEHHQRRFKTTGITEP